MRSRMIQVLAVSGLLSLSGCVFTQWTDHAFFGSPDDPPTHAEREWLGVAVLPLAVLGDILTAPGQAIALLIMGDGGMYKAPNGRVAVALEMPSGGGRDATLAAVTPVLRAQLAAAKPGTGLRVWGVDADHRVVEIPLTSVQQAEVAGRLDAAAAHPGA